MGLQGSLPGRAAPSVAETAALVERITMEGELRNALTAGDLVLRYQPIVALGSGRVMAFETLCRWRHWSKGLLGPAHFLPLAEESGLIVPLGSWVFEESSRRLAQWRNRLREAAALDVTVNLSATELRDRTLVDRTAQALESSGLAAGHLVVEVSEAAAYREPQTPAAENLSGLADLGIGLAIDDVGASGRPDPARWLWSLPLRMIKVERGVAASLSGSDPYDGMPPGRAGRILAIALRLAGEHGVPAVVKGIETADQLELFTSLGCLAGQGFLFARPMDPTDAEAYLRRFRPARLGAAGSAAPASDAG